MEKITLDYIVQYLSGGNKSTIFPLQPHETVNVSYLQNAFGKLFDDNYIRYGMPTLKNRDVSGYLSIIFCIKSNFIEIDDFEQYYTKLKQQLIDNINLTTNFTLKELKKDIIHDIKSNEFNVRILYYLSYFLNINIFVIDETIPIILTYYCDPEFNMYKNSICLIKKNDIYEPILNKDFNGLIKYDNPTLNNILCLEETTSVNINNPNEKHPLEINLDISSMLKYYDIEINNIDEQEEIESNEKQEEIESIEEQEEINYHTYTVDKLMVYKKNELLDILKKYGHKEKSLNSMTKPKLIDIIKKQK